MSPYIQGIFDPERVNYGKKILEWHWVVMCLVLLSACDTEDGLKEYWVLSGRPGFVSAVTQAHPDELRHRALLRGLYEMKTWVWSLKLSLAFRIACFPRAALLRQNPA